MDTFSEKFYGLSYSTMPPVASAVNNMPMGCPVLQQPGMAAPGQPHVSPMACGPPSSHVVNGIPAPGGYHPIGMNSGNGYTSIYLVTFCFHVFSNFVQVKYSMVIRKVREIFFKTLFSCLGFMRNLKQIGSSW